MPRRESIPYCDLGAGCVWGGGVSDSSQDPPSTGSLTPTPSPTPRTTQIHLGCSWASVNVATAAQRKQRHPVLRLHTVDASSSANSTPPTGAPNAAANPAAAPADTSSRWSVVVNVGGAAAAAAAAEAARPGGSSGS